ncbi:hypothetical protein HMPREF9098_1966 [Kingella denitrificans ATCC 33394]|uniref:Uncharacterized protein n=1 Tax=Kingella denitrificans ATCC 33394 TaxID=888741 RepID=F0F1I1_9NEIS|nr:hypothetical protein HMPREF9098_1966 [Kingella denitrificans ATCC 33394]
MVQAAFCGRKAACIWKIGVQAAWLSTTLELVRKIHRNYYFAPWPILLRCQAFF